MHLGQMYTSTLGVGECIHVKITHLLRLPSHLYPQLTGASTPGHVIEKGSIEKLSLTGSVCASGTI